MDGGERRQRLQSGAITLAAVVAVLGVQVRGSAGLAGRALGIAIAVPAVLWLSRHKAIALGALFLFLPVQQSILAFLYTAGVPAAIVRNAGYYKEAVAAGLILAIVRLPAAQRRPLRAVDRAGLALVAVATFYLVLPVLISGVLGGQPWSIRFLAWRLNVLFVLFFLLVRRLPWAREEVQLLEKCLIVTGALIAAGGLWELLGQTSYDRFMVDAVGQPTYLRDVLGQVDRQQGTVLVYGEAGYVRVGGWVINPLSLGFSLILPLAVAMHRLSRDRRTLVPGLVVAACAVTLYFTLTRSALLSGGIAVVIAIWGSVRAKYSRAVGVAIAAAVALICLAPLIPGTDAADRVVGALQGTDSSAQTHSERSSSALRKALNEPLGLGLGSNPTTGLLEKTSNSVIAEDNYLQVSLELGWVALLAFVLLTAAALRELLAEHRRRSSTPAIAALGAGTGLAVGAFFLHVWLDFPTALLFWSFAGVLTSAGGSPFLAAEADERVPDRAAASSTSSE